MKVKKLAAVVAVSIIFCSIALASNYVKPDDISKVNLGDTFDQVTQKIGQQQMVSKSLDAQGKEQVVWLYNATLAQQRGGSNPGQEVLEDGLTDTDSAAPRDPSRLQNAEAAYIEQKTQNITPQGVIAYETAKGAVPSRIMNVPYLIIFTDGKVSSIERQDQYKGRYV